MRVYLDESGDLGFSFEKPFREGGSSRYLTIALLLIPPEKSYLPKRIVKEIYKKRKRPPEKELKGAALNISEKEYFAKKVIAMLIGHPEMEILSITADKRNVVDNIRQDPNKLYNYMTRLILLERIKEIEKITFIPDPRSIKVRHGVSLATYLQNYLKSQLNSKTILDNIPQESHTALNLQFIDWIAHIIWEKYENLETIGFNILQNKVKVTELFFTPI